MVLFYLMNEAKWASEISRALCMCRTMVDVPVNILVMNQTLPQIFLASQHFSALFSLYEGWNFNSGNYLFTTDTK